MTSFPSVREVDPGAAAHDAIRIWSESLHLEGAPERKIDFFYRESPLGPASMFALVAPDSDEIIGVAGLGKRRFHIDGATVDAGLLADLAVARRHRTLLPACRLVAHVRDQARERFAFTYGMPNAAAEGVFVREGYTRVARMTRWVRPLRFGPHVARFVPFDAIASAAGAVLDTADGLFRAPARRAATQGAELAWVERFDARFDGLFLDASADYPFVGERSAAFLAWRFFRAPAPAPRIATLLRRGRLAAYAVVDVDTIRHVAHLLDLFGHPDDVGALVELLAGDFRERGVSALSLRYLGRGWMHALLRDHGFVERESSRAVCILRGNDRGEALPLDDLAHWHLTDADEDV